MYVDVEDGSFYVETPDQVIITDIKRRMRRKTEDGRSKKKNRMRTSS
jgi:hypothetical protein